MDWDPSYIYFCSTNSTRNQLFLFYELNPRPPVLSAPSITVKIEQCFFCRPGSAHFCSTDARPTLFLFYGRRTPTLFLFYGFLFWFVESMLLGEWIKSVTMPSKPTFWLDADQYSRLQIAFAVPYRLRSVRFRAASKFIIQQLWCPPPQPIINIWHFHTNVQLILKVTVHYLRIVPSSPNSGARRQCSSESSRALEWLITILTRSDSTNPENHCLKTKELRSRQRSASVTWCLRSPVK